MIHGTDPVEGGRQTGRQAALGRRLIRKALAFIHSSIHMDVPPQGERHRATPFWPLPRAVGCEFRPSAFRCHQLI